jgi:hypothetical protein
MRMQCTRAHDSVTISDEVGCALRLPRFDSSQRFTRMYMQPLGRGLAQIAALRVVPRRVAGSAHWQLHLAPIVARQHVVQVGCDAEIAHDDLGHTVQAHHDVHEKATTSSPEPSVVREAAKCFSLASRSMKTGVCRQHAQPAMSDLPCRLLRFCSMLSIVTSIAQRLDHWRSVLPADTMDGAFAGDALLDTSRVVLAHGSPSQQATFMHIATNSIQCCWQLTPDGLSRNL